MDARRSIYGGVEHAILHLLYSRFFMRALSLDNKEINIKEPLKDCSLKEWFVMKHTKMKTIIVSPDEVFTENGKDFLKKEDHSVKVKVDHLGQCRNQKNTIDPQNIIELYGADAVRFFILADSPPEKDIQWSDEGMILTFKFVQKFWLLNEEILKLQN